MDILKNNVTDIIELLNKLVNQNLKKRSEERRVGKVKDMQKPKTNSSKESIRRKIEIEEKMRHEREKSKSTKIGKTLMVI